jgi:hypothetical protein
MKYEVSGDLVILQQADVRTFIHHEKQPSASTASSPKDWAYDERGM